MEVGDLKFLLKLLSGQEWFLGHVWFVLCVIFVVVVKLNVLIEECRAEETGKSRDRVNFHPAQPSQLTRTYVPYLRKLPTTVIGNRISRGPSNQSYPIRHTVVTPNVPLNPYIYISCDKDIHYNLCRRIPPQLRRKTSIDLEQPESNGSISRKSHSQIWSLGSRRLQTL